MGYICWDGSFEVWAYPKTRLYEDMIKKGMNEEYLKRYRQFKLPSKMIKYHVMNITSLNGMSYKKLNNYINEGYQRFNEKIS